MCGGFVDWCSFTWEAFATLATGLAAVCAAWWIGRKQTKIQIAQVDVQRMTLRAELFDRRYEVYEFTRIFLNKINTVYQDDIVDLREDWVRNFLSAMQKSKIIFSRAVFDGLDQIWRKAVEFSALKEEMGEIYREEGHYGAGNPERKRIAMTWLFDQLEKLPELFEELNLGSLAGSVPPPFAASRESK